MGAIVKLISLFTKRERRRLIPISLAILCASVLEIVEVGSLGPFMAVVADPDLVHRQPLLAGLYRLGGFQDRPGGDTAFLIFLGAAVFAVIIAVTVFRTGVFYAAYRFTANRRYTLSVRLFRQYLFQPYRFFLEHNTGELSKNLLAEVDQAVSEVLWPATDVLISGVLSLAVFALLVALNPPVAVFAIGGFGSLYLGLYVVVRPRLSRYGQALREANRIRYKIAAEAFGGIKDVKILGKESYFTAAYSRGARRFAASQAANQILSSLPGQALQSLAVGFAMAMIVILLIIHGSLTEVLPLLAVYAFAVMRLMPNLQHIFQDMARIRYSAHTVDALYRDMTSLAAVPEIAGKPVSELDATEDVFPFERNIELQAVRFSYPASREPVLKDISLSVTKNTSVAFAGTTGCGKTTLVDVIMGLLEPDEGSITVDGVPVASPSGTDSWRTVASWQRNFGYVPQQIFLSDDTVAANIAFGIPEDQRDAGAVERAAQTANLHNFISAELPAGYNTVVGERGIRLSGGQRQRVGIARALYHDPRILVMDEATSALDSVTEDAVMDAIHRLMHTKTVIIIAHRLSTVRECDVIYLMEHGRIEARGSYGELLKDSPYFRAMAKTADRNHPSD